jgi:hypothetical protein
MIPDIEIYKGIVSLGRPLAARHMYFENLVPAMIPFPSLWIDSLSGADCGSR